MENSQEEISDSDSEATIEEQRAMRADLETLGPYIRKSEPLENGGENQNGAAMQELGEAISDDNHEQITPINLRLMSGKGTVEDLNRFNEWVRLQNPEINDTAPEQGTPSMQLTSSVREDTSKNSSDSMPLARKLKNWQGSELCEKKTKQDQFLAWMDFKKIFALNTSMLEISNANEKLVALKLKGGPLVMAKLAPIDTQTTLFTQAWSFLEKEFESPINKREELGEFMNMKMEENEDTFAFQARVIKQGHLGGYTPETNEKELVDKMIYGHLQPMFFTAGQQSISALTIASLKDSAVMYEQTRKKPATEAIQPTLNIENEVNHVAATPKNTQRSYQGPKSRIALRQQSF